MLKFAKWGILTGALLCMTCTCAFAGAHGGGHSRPHDKGTAILLVTFGTSIPEAQIAFSAMEKRVKAAYPDVPIRWAYTSTIIRKKLDAQGSTLESLPIALSHMMEEGYSKVAVQSLHMMAGHEFHYVRVNARKFAEMVEGFDKVMVGRPLLSTDEDLERAADAIVKLIPAKRKPNEAVVLMGHGSHHPADSVFSAMMYKVQKRDPNVFVGTVEGHPDFEDVKSQILKKGLKKAWLMPLMSVAGDHSVNDLVGDEDDSWKSMLTKAGVECVPVLKGLAEIDAFGQIWVDHLKTAMRHLQ